MTTFTPHCKTCRCGSITVATQERHESESFTIDRWIGACLRVDEQGAGKIYRRHLVRSFEAWCEDQGIEAPSSRALYARLRGLGHQEIKIRGRFYFRGLDCDGRIDTRDQRARQEAEEAAEIEEMSATVDASGAEAAPAVT